jgi:hypothetical protein
MQAFFINLMAGRPMVPAVIFQYRFPLFADSRLQGTPRMEGASFFPHPMPVPKKLDQQANPHP